MRLTSFLGCLPPRITRGRTHLALRRHRKSKHRATVAAHFQKRRPFGNRNHRYCRFLLSRAFFILSARLAAKRSPLVNARHSFLVSASACCCIPKAKGRVDKEIALNRPPPQKGRSLQSCFNARESR